MSAKHSTIQLCGYVLTNSNQGLPGSVSLSNVEYAPGIEVPRHGLTLFYGTKDQVLGLAAVTQSARRAKMAINSVVLEVDAGHVPVEKMRLARFAGGPDVKKAERCRMLNFQRVTSEVRDYIAKEIERTNKAGLRLPNVDSYDVPALFSKAPAYLDLIPQMEAFKNISVVVWSPQRMASNMPGQLATLYDNSAVIRAYVRGHPEIEVVLPRTKHLNARALRMG